MAKDNVATSVFVNFKLNPDVIAALKLPSLPQFIFRPDLHFRYPIDNVLYHCGR